MHSSVSTGGAPGAHLITHNREEVSVHLITEELISVARSLCVAALRSNFAALRSTHKYDPYEHRNPYLNVKAQRFSDYSFCGRVWLGTPDLG